MNRFHAYVIPSPYGSCTIGFLEHELAFVGFGPTAFEEMQKTYPEEQIIVLPDEEGMLVHITWDGIENVFCNFRLHLKGTTFQKKVWRYLQDMPLAAIVTYQDIAHEIGHPRAVRAVANAVGKNPISFFIPCHRVIKGNGDLGGYRWGIELKKRLLMREGKVTGFNSCGNG